MTLEEALQGWRWDGADGAALAQAFAQSERTGRGIRFVGTVGSGKTTAASLLAKKRNGLYIDCSNPEKAAALREWRTWAMPDRSIVLDEFGRDSVRNDFGNRTDVVAQFIREIYSSWKEGEWTGRLYVTTNLAIEKMKEVYDESITDRLLEMCVTCHFVQNRRISADHAEPAKAKPATNSFAVGLRDQAREDAFWDRSIARAKAEWEKDGPRNIAELNAEHDGTPHGLWHCAWKVAKNELRVWTAKDCALVGVAWHRGLGRPKPRRYAEGEQRAFELPAVLHGIVAAHWDGEDDTAAWFAARALAWARKVLGPEGDRIATAHAEGYGNETVDWAGHLADAQALIDWNKEHARRVGKANAGRIDFAAVAGGL